MKALAEAAAARKIAQFERLIAEKEHARKDREAEIEGKRQQERTEHEKELSILAANRKVAVTDAKLKVIERVIDEEENESKYEISEMPKLKSEVRTEDWVRTNFTVQNPPQETEVTRQSHQNLPRQIYADNPCEPEKSNHINFSPNGMPASSTPILEASVSHLIESLALSNKKVVAGLSRQSLPKCHPDTFGGDPTIFHPWKEAFKAKINDAEVSPMQEINYLRRFTTGESQCLVDNYRKRNHHNPQALLENLWSELERRFGKTAVITNALLDCMQTTASFNENENKKLQEFADLCEDVESQVAYLPGLACLNYPNAIQPIADKLPPPLRGKWEKQVAKYSDRNGGPYPSFSLFSQLVHNHARVKIDPNIHIGAKQPKQRPFNRRVLKSRTERDLKDPHTSRHNEAERAKHCLFHNKVRQNLEECKAFATKTYQEKTDWISKAGICFKCLSGDHQANVCERKIRCGICGDNRNLSLLHKEKLHSTQNDSEAVNARCTSVCNINGGASCSKILLVDVLSKITTDSPHRVYAIIDEQSNSSFISSELADELGADGPREKYYLSTSTSEHETKYGRRVPGVYIRSLNGIELDIPTLVEFQSILRDKREILTPETTARFPHLKQIAGEITPLDDNAEVHLLIGRDVPELLKVRNFINGPKGAPWAQRLSLGGPYQDRHALTSYTQ